MSKETATEFFRQLQAFSSEVFQQILGLNVTASEWSEKLKDNKPLRGAIIHYTADDRLEKAARWFLDSKYHAKASAHVIVGDARDPRAEAIVKQYPLVAALPATVVQCVPPDRVAWHATWASEWSYGIECTNAGEVRPDGQGGFLWWPEVRPGSGPWSTPWRGSTPILGPGGRYWVPYPYEQVETVAMVLRQVRDYLGWGAEAMILGHEQVQGTRTLRWEGGPPMGTDKRDPGPLFPLHELCDAVADDHFPLVDPGMVRRADYGVLDLAGRLESAGYVSWGDLATAVRLSGAPDDQIVVLALAMLRYPIFNVPESARDRIIRIFQRMTGLKTDGIPGPITCAAIADRILDRYGS